MYSTQDNLTNPLKQDWIIIDPVVETWKTPNVLTMSQMEYDCMGSHDPLTYYHVLGPGGVPRIYFGDLPIEKEMCSCKYLMGPEDHGMYSIYIVITDNRRTAIFEIARFHDLQQAIKILHLWNENIGHSVSREEVCEAIRHYQYGDVSCNEFILSIISMFGYKNDPRLQDVVQLMRTYNYTDNNRDISRFAKEQVEYMRGNPKNQLFGKYAEIYDYMVATDFFKHIEPKIVIYANTLTAIMQK